MKLSPEDLNFGSYPPHPTSIYTCRVTVVLRVCGGKTGIFNYLFVEAIIKCFEKKLLTMKWSLGERKVQMLTDVCT